MQLDLLQKVRSFVRNLRKLHILDGHVQEQMTLLGESYNARFDHLARSIAPETLAPAAAWHDHLVNLALASIIKEPVKTPMKTTGFPPQIGRYDGWLQLLSRKPGDGGTAILPIHTKSHACFAAATGRGMHALGKTEQKWLPEEWETVEQFTTAHGSMEKVRDDLLDLDMEGLPDKVAQPI